MENEKKIGLFPLNVCLLPGEDLPLRIFEPRYKDLINDCSDKEQTFGIPFMKKSDMQSFGSEVKIKQIVARNSQGEMVIVVEGVSNFEMIRYRNPWEDKLYAGGSIVDLEEIEEVKDPGLMKMLIHYTDQLDPEFLKDVKGNSIRLLDVAKALNLSSEDKFRFISLRSLSEKEKFLKSQMNYLLKLREQEKLLNNDYYLN